MRTATAAIIILLVLVIGFVLSVRHTYDAPSETPVATGAVVPAVEYHDKYSKGTHTISGTVVAPTACSSVSADATVVESEASSSPETIQVALTMPADSGICLTTATEIHFSVSAEAGADAMITVLVNGAAVPASEY